MGDRIDILSTLWKIVILLTASCLQEGQALNNSLHKSQGVHFTPTLVLHEKKNEPSAP